jgi:hypothetical protein
MGDCSLLLIEKRIGGDSEMWGASSRHFFKSSADSINATEPARSW